jgi:ornithine lipid hydroxylase
MGSPGPAHSSERLLSFQDASVAEATDGQARPGPLRNLLTYGLFPVIMFGAVAASLVMLARGIEPGLVNLFATAPAVLLIILFERVHPFEREWNKSHGDLGHDSVYFVIILATLGLTTAALRAAFVPVAGWLSAHAPFAIWPNSLPMLVQLVLGLIVAEFGLYWSHRIMHGKLWRIHALHHSAPRLYWLNTTRFHPFDMALSTICGFGPLLLLGVNEAVLALVTMVGTIHSFFQHANINVKLGPLNYFFSMAELHRWHHSKTLDEANANYGNHLSVWDVVFRTRYLPADRLPPREIGILHPQDFPMTLAGQLLSPAYPPALFREPEATAPKPAE